ncbi:MAG: carboxypeptidase-like regulatory domain-containing protein, partial [Polyangiaceae bacterium]
VLILPALVLAAICGVACNPTHSDQVAALGDEANGVNEGPTHRPGQPCLVCHDGAFGDPTAFSVAGTIYETAGSTTPVNGASIELIDVTGTKYSATSNEAGNFYVSPSAFTPHYPMTVTVTASGTKVTMQSLISRNGACAGCHVDPAGPSSAGRVAMMLEDGGTPP